jgi:hypothetical protein
MVDERWSIIPTSINWSLGVPAVMDGLFKAASNIVGVPVDNLKVLRRVPRISRPGFMI